MKRLLLTLSLSALALAQTPLHRGEIQVHAQRQDTNGVVMHLTGNVTIETDTMQLRADSADFNSDTQEIAAQGNVRIKLK